MPLADIQYIIIVIRDNKYDCILDRLVYSNREDCKKRIKLARGEDALSKTHYDYIIESIWK